MPPPILRVPDSFLKFSAHGLTNMFEKIRILLKFWPFSAASATLVTGAKICNIHVTGTAFCRFLVG